jgi:protoporphyrinogen/coproporphyrinogen III oxidase
VIGGGVSGLAAAHYVAHPAVPADTPPVSVTVLEADARLGGKVASQDVAGSRVDTGPDALLVRAPAAAALVSELGLGGSLRAPAGTGAFIWTGGELRPLPAGSMFGVPDRLWPLLRTGLLGPWGFVRAGADLVLPRREGPDDPTIEQLLRPRFGRQVYERLIEPMLGGVHAGRASRLSARSAVPEVVALTVGHRSLFLALRRRGPRTGGPALMTFDGGLERLIDALRASVEQSPGCRVLTGTRARSLVRSGHGWTVLTDGPGPEAAGGAAAVEVDDVVLATPAWETARLLRPLAPAAAMALEAIPYAGVATVTLAYPRSQAELPLRGTGFLVPPVEGRLLVGCSWLSAKWPHLGHHQHTVLRCMVGRDGDQAWAELDDAQLVRAVRAELVTAMGLTAEPAEAHVRRMPRAMPQYTVGHAGRLAVVDAALGALPGLRVTGAGYRGVGIAGCIAQARAVAAAMATSVQEGAPA